MASLIPEAFSEFDQHEQVVPVNDPATGLAGFIAIHHTRQGFPSLGATRFWKFTSPEEALRDALRLSKLMSFKSALAGLPYGGAKAVLIEPSHSFDREKLFQRYGQAVEGLEGAFVTGTDVGVHDSDLRAMLKETKYVIGAGVDAGYFTAVGVFYCIAAVFRHHYNNDTVSERSFMIQGLGKTGYSLLKLLYDAGARRIFVSDFNAALVQQATKEFPGVTGVAPDDVFAQPVDIFCPCALGGILNTATVPLLKVKAVVGAANNQLATPDVDRLLFERGILYAPDYLVNAGGILSVVDQYEHAGTHDAARILARLKNIPITLATVLATSSKEKRGTSAVADAMANTLLAATVTA